MRTRRKFIKYVLSGIIGFPLLKGVRANYKPKVVVIGGGFGGSTVIKYLEKYIENLDLILIEKKKNFYTCPFSNYVIGGFRNINQNKFSYNNMIKRGVNVIFDNVKFIDSENKKIQLNNSNISYDWLVLSPGIGFKWDSIIGFNQKNSINNPIAWSGGKESSILFKKIIFNKK